MEDSWSAANFGLKTQSENLVSITPLYEAELAEWLIAQPQYVQLWVDGKEFKAKSGTHIVLPSTSGLIRQVLVGLGKPGKKEDFWAWGKLPRALPPSFDYTLDMKAPAAGTLDLGAIAFVWALGCYTFKGFKTREEIEGEGFASLKISQKIKDQVMPLVKSVYWIRDLINLPPNILTPQGLANQAMHLRKYGATVNMLVGEQLNDQHYPAVYAVGRGSEYAPHVIDIQWGDASHPKVTLVGKGVTFDTGGLDLKPPAYMKLMKKDMGGAAHALGLAAIIMAMDLPIRLRVLIGAVENAVSMRSYRPSDVVNTRKGLTVEIGDTDAEGRVVLSDLLFEACEENPQLLVGFATLTGAARVALGPDVPALFSNDDALARDLQDISLACHDPLWHMPLWKPYKSSMKSQVADINNISASNYGDAICAALFLNEFVKESTPWVHLDFMGWNASAKPGRPEGGEAFCLRAVLGLMNKKFDLKLDLF